MRSFKQALAVFFFLSLILGFASCKKESFTVNYELILYNNTIGDPVPDDFLGLSYETRQLTDTTYFNKNNTVYVNLIKGLGNGLFRVGGSTLEKVMFSRAARKGRTLKDTVFADDVTRFAAFQQAIGWKVMYGLNLAKATPAAGGIAATYVQSKLGSNLYSFDIGNEPDLYNLSGIRPANYNVNDYNSEFAKYYAVVQPLVPGVSFTGPAAGYHDAWVPSFVAANGNKMKTITSHYYRLPQTADTVLALQTLLTFDDALPQKIKTFVDVSKSAGANYRMAECNSISSGGQKGLSDTFASVLWGSEFLFYLAQSNVAGINFHGGTNGIYSPITVKNGAFAAAPLYYAMLMFHNAQIKQFLKSSIGNGGGKVSAFYFLRQDGRKAIFLENKDPLNAQILKINNFQKANIAEIHLLTAPSVKSTTGVTLDNIAVDASGNWNTSSAAPLDVNILDVKDYSLNTSVSLKPLSVYILVLK